MFSKKHHKIRSSEKWRGAEGSGRDKRVKQVEKKSKTKLWKCTQGENSVQKTGWTKILRERGAAAVGEAGDSRHRWYLQMIGWIRVPLVHHGAFSGALSPTKPLTKLPFRYDINTPTWFGVFGRVTESKVLERYLHHSSSSPSASARVLQSTVRFELVSKLQCIDCCNCHKKTSCWNRSTSCLVATSQELPENQVLDTLQHNSSLSFYKTNTLSALSVKYL